MKTKHFVFLLVEDHAQLSLSCALEPLRIANMISARDLYSWALTSEDGEGATCSNGTVSKVQSRFGEAIGADWTFVLSGDGMAARMSPALKATLRRIKRSGSRLGALCSGAWILAEMGYLDGMKAALHWEYHDAFAERFPDVQLVRNVFVSDEKHVTASGGMAIADLMLHLIEVDHGRDLALAVSDMMVLSGVREASAPQQVSLQSRMGVRNAHLARAISQMKASLENPLQSSDIARDLGISVRQLERLFGRLMHTTPKRYYNELRLDRARHLLLQTEMSVAEVAIACGFENPSHFSRTYRSRFGTSPKSQSYRIA